MAREEELKRIDLKVNVSCCEGCRRKVMKAMSLKGVLRTEIQPSHDRVTVVGDVDAKVLVKKLAKIGKIAEVLPPASEEGKKRDDGGSKKAGDRPAQAEERSAGNKAKAAGKPECKKCAHEAARADVGNGDRADDGGNGDHGSGKAPPPRARGAAAKGSEEGGEGDGLGAKSSAADRHASPQPQLHYHRAEPPMVVPGFYAPTPAPYYGYYGMPPPPPPMMSLPMPPMGPPPQLRPQPSRFDEDFFNEDNTIGCRVM